MSPCAKGAYSWIWVKVGFKAIARAAKTIVRASFLVFMFFGSLFGFNASVTYLRVTTQKKVAQYT